MQVTINNLKITIDDVPAGVFAVPNPIQTCTKGYAVYRYVGNRKMWRVGGTTCGFPLPGSTAGTAPSSVMISTDLDNTLKALWPGDGKIAEIRFALCCPPPPNVTPMEKTATAKSRAAKKKGRTAK